MNDWNSYDEVAEIYERVHAPRLAMPARDLVEVAEIPAGGRVLDVGTGTGVAAEAALEVAGPDGVVVGVDRAVQMLAVGKRTRPDLAIVAGVAVDLPFRGGTFDAVVANFVISHFKRYETALADIIRVLKPGGRLAVSAWSDEQDELQATWSALLQEVIPREMLEPVWKEAAPWHDRFRDRTKLEEALMDSGLRRIRSEIREYRFSYPIDEYVSGLEAWATGRFARQMLGEERWRKFRVRARAVFAERFADPLNDFRTVNLAVAVKP